MILPRICKRRGFLRRLLAFTGTILFLVLVVTNMNPRKPPEKPIFEHLTKSHISSLRTKSSTKPRKVPNKNGDLMKGKLNLDIWIKICSVNINSLRQFPLFPHFPNERKHLSVQDTIQFDIKDKKLAIRIMGFIHPLKTGFHTFLLRTFALAQLWLGTSGPNSTEQIAFTTHNIIERRVFDLGDPKPVSNSIHLHRGRKYYFEILLVATEALPQPASVSLMWMVPGTTYFTKIDGAQVSAYYSLPFVYETPELNFTVGTDKHVPSLMFSEEEDKLTSLVLPDQLKSAKKIITFTLKQPHIKNMLARHFDGGLQYDRTSVRGLPYMDISRNHFINALFSKCQYDPGYIKLKELKRYKGVWNTFFPKIFPKDRSDFVRFYEPGKNYYGQNIRGNDVMLESEALMVVKTFMDVVNKASPR